MANPGFSIVLLEDDFSFSLEIELLLEKMGLELVARFVRAEDALEYVKHSPPSLVLSDIFLNGEMTGVEFGQQIKEYNIPIILFTVDADRTLYEEAKKAILIAYIIKPFDDLTLQAAIELAQKRLRLLNLGIEAASKMEETQTIYKDSFFIKKNKKLHKIEIKDIYWIQSDGNYCTIFTDEGKHVVLMSLTKLKNKLPVDKFVQTHRSFLVQLNKVSNVDYTNNQLVVNSESLPIGRRFKSQLIKRLNFLH